MLSIAKRIHTGDIFSEIYQVKGFNFSQDMHKFLNKQHTNEWHEIRQPLKSGKYKVVGLNEWVKIK